VDHKEFILSVADRSGLSRQESQDVTHSTLQTLADRISGGETRQLAVHLPDEFRQYLTPRQEGAHQFGLDEFVRRVSEHTGLTEQEATNGIRGVFLTLRDGLPEDPFGDVLSQLPKDFERLVGAAG
jgi:uncharacterized protein (DUF2267 family)